MRPMDDHQAQDELVLAAAVRIAELVAGLRAGRKTISASRRNDICERDSWNCGTCGKPVDKTLRYTQCPRPEGLAILASRGPADMRAIAAWVDGDPDRACAVESMTVRWAGWWREAPSRHRNVYDRHVAPAVEAFRVRNGQTAGVEHLIPVSIGGTNNDDNLVIAHRKCNINWMTDAPNGALLHAAVAAKDFPIGLARPAATSKPPSSSPGATGCGRSPGWPARSPNARRPAPNSTRRSLD